MTKSVLQKMVICSLFIVATLLFAWSFGAAQYEPPHEEDYPRITGVTPPNGATGVSVDTLITATFSAIMNQASINESSFYVNVYEGAASSQRTRATNISGVVTYNATTRTATFTPAAPLLPETTYRATVSEAVTDISGRHLQGSFLWSFSTEGEPPPAPQVVNTEPAAGATGVSTAVNPSATFSADMDPSSFDGAFLLEETGALASSRARTLVSGMVTYNSSSKTATFIPSSPFSYGTEYTATITSAAQSPEGVALENDYSWSFTTEEGVSAPQVDHTDPEDGATGVQRDIIVAATFTQDMNPSTINDTSFMLEETGASASTRVRTLLSGTVEYDASFKEAKFVPDNLLSYGTGYTATITTAAESSAGVPLAEDYAWTFTTETEPPEPEEETLYSPDLPPGHYQMISVPLWASDPIDVFGDDLGPYDPMMWRLFWTDPDTGWYLEYPDVPDVSPGIAYWLISRDARAVTATGRPVTDETFPIDIPPGWFQLGNPYNDNVSKGDLQVEFTETPDTLLLPSLRDGINEESTKKDTIASQARITTTVLFSESPLDDVLWEWDASINNWTTTDTMVPWGGWLVYNNSANPVTLLIPNPAIGPGPGEGSLSVFVRDATTADEIVGATVTLNGFTATTNEFGYATIADTPTGPFTLTVIMEGYSTYQQEITLAVGLNDFIVDLSPQLAEDQIRMVLTWGENPHDLDAHLVGPDAGGGRFEVYFGNKNPAGAGANLDIDNIQVHSGFGPETITITEIHVGTYSYFVDWFSGTGTWGTSGARVDVYGDEGLLTSFSVQSPGAVTDFWHVFDLDGETGEITPVNTIVSVAPTSMISADLEGGGRLEGGEAENIFRKLPRKPYGN